MMQQITASPKRHAQCRCNHFQGLMTVFGRQKWQIANWQMAKILNGKR